MLLVKMFKLRNVEHSDIDKIVSINESAIPAVNYVSYNEFEWFLHKKLYFKLAENFHGAISGFLLVLPSGLEYKSLNYKWFSGKYKKFAYIDRIVIMDEFRNNGIGKGLYLDLEKSISDYELIACEFNIEPPNPISKKFHESLNYENVGYQLTENATKKVSLMIKKIL